MNLKMLIYIQNHFVSDLLLKKKCVNCGSNICSCISGKQLIIQIELFQNEISILNIKRKTEKRELLSEKNNFRKQKICANKFE